MGSTKPYTVSNFLKVIIITVEKIVPASGFMISMTVVRLNSCITHRKLDRQTDRQTDIDRQTDGKRQTTTQTDRQIDSRIDRLRRNRHIITHRKLDR